MSEDDISQERVYRGTSWQKEEPRPGTRGTYTHPWDQYTQNTPLGHFLYDPEESRLVGWHDEGHRLSDEETEDWTPHTDKMVSGPVEADALARGVEPNSFKQRYDPKEDNTNRDPIWLSEDAQEYSPRCPDHPSDFSQEFEVPEQLQPKNRLSFLTDPRQLGASVRENPLRTQYPPRFSDKRVITDPGPGGGGPDLPCRDCGAKPGELCDVNCPSVGGEPLPSDDPMDPKEVSDWTTRTRLKNTRPWDPIEDVLGAPGPRGPMIDSRDPQFDRLIDEEDDFDRGMDPPNLSEKFHVPLRQHPMNRMNSVDRY
jgi:hypothetical protein